MATPQRMVGIDVARDYLDVALLVRSEASSPSWDEDRFANTEAGRAELCAWVEARTPERVVLEASGGYEQLLLAELGRRALGACVRRVNARAVRDFARSQGILAKTDRLDARVLARFAAQMKWEASAAPVEPARQAFSQLMGRRRQLVEMLSVEQTRRTQLDQQGGGSAERASLGRHVAWLKEELAELDREIETQIEQHPHWQAQEARLRSVPGVGPLLARTLLGCVPELGRLSPRKLGMLLGVAPLACESGTRRGQRHIWGGRREVRRVLYMATLSAIRCNERVRRFYQGLCARGKPHKVAHIACARKLLLILNAMQRDGTDWDPTLAGA